MENRYFVIELDNPKVGEIMSHALSTLDTSEKSNDGKKTGIKLPLNDDTNYECLEGIIEYDNNEMVIRMQEPDFKRPEQP